MPSKKEKTNKAKDVKKNKIIGIGLALIAVLLFIFIFTFLYFKLFKSLELAKILPKDQTIAFAEINIDNMNSEVREIKKYFENYEVYNKNSLIEKINNQFGIDFVLDVEPFLGRQLGAAIFDTQNKKPVFFIDVKSKELALSFLKKRLAQNAEPQIESLSENKSIYSFDSGFYLTFIKNYSVFSQDQDAIRILTDYDSYSKLSKDFDYITVSNNLPINRLAYFFANPSKSFDYLSNNELNPIPNLDLLNILKPFIGTFKGIGGSVNLENSNLAIQTFSSVDKNRFKDKTFMHFNKKFEAELANFIENDAIFYTGSFDLKTQIERLSEIFNDIHPQSKEILEGLTEGQIKKYFGEQISLQNDIYPILQNEYSFSIHGTPESKQYKVIITLNEKQQNIETVNKIMDNFIKLSAVYAPKIVDVVLPDGTQGQEIVANPEDIQESTVQYKGYTIDVIKVGNKPWGINYAFVKDKVIFASSENLIKNSIDLIEGEAGSLAKSPRYKDRFGTALGKSDEITTFDLSSIISTYLNNENFKNYIPYLTPFSSDLSMKNYFDDGIYSAHFLNIDYEPKRIQ